MGGGGGLIPAEGERAESNLPSHWSSSPITHTDAHTHAHSYARALALTHPPCCYCSAQTLMTHLSAVWSTFPRGPDANFLLPPRTQPSATPSPGKASFPAPSPSFPPSPSDTEAEPLARQAPGFGFSALWGTQPGPHSLPWLALGGAPGRRSWEAGELP